MKHLNILMLTAGLFVACTAQAQTSLQDQINAMKATESEAQAAERARQEAYDRQARQRAAAAQARRDKERADAQARADKAEAERQADKTRDQNYEDQQRNLALESQKLDLQMKAAKAKRADDYVEQDLNREKAQTDVVQSRADANRSISKGAENMMSGVGQGAAQKKGLFD